MMEHIIKQFLLSNVEGSLEEQDEEQLVDLLESQLEEEMAQVEEEGGEAQLAQAQEQVGIWDEGGGEAGMGGGGNRGYVIGG